MLTDRLRRLAEAQRFVPEVVQVAPDTQTALALVSAEVGCLLTLSSVAANQADPHVTFVPVAASEERGLPDVHLRAAWRTDERSPAVRAVLAVLLEVDQADEPSGPPVSPSSGSKVR